MRNEGQRRGGRVSMFPSHMLLVGKQVKSIFCYGRTRTNHGSFAHGYASMKLCLKFGDISGRSRKRACGRGLSQRRVCALTALEAWLEYLNLVGWFVNLIFLTAALVPISWQLLKAITAAHKPRGPQSIVYQRSMLAME